MEVKKRLIFLFLLLNSLVVVLVFNSYLTKTSTTHPSLRVLKNVRHTIHMPKHNPPPVVHMTSNTTATTRGIIICVYERAVSLALSLITELRCLGNNLPIHITHCYELSPKSIAKFLSHNGVTVLNVCEQMAESGRIEDITKFRNFFIKPLSLVHTQLDEVMLLDSDNIFLRNPNLLWETEGYKKTGTLFFYDRVIHDNNLFNKNSSKDKSKSWLNLYVHEFPHEKFWKYKGGVGSRLEQRPYQPSPQLLESHAWKRQTMHHQDSSIVLWNKKRQERATQILLYVIQETARLHEFSYGDKEAFWLSCELAQTDYSFSPWGVSVVSAFMDMQNHPDTLCGSIAQYMPVETEKPELLYVNGRALVQTQPVPSDKLAESPIQNLFNDNPTHVTVRRRRQILPKHSVGPECLYRVPSSRIPQFFLTYLTRRRAHFEAFNLNTNWSLSQC